MKIPQLVTFKGVRPPEEVPHGVVVAMSRSGWNNEEVWLEKCWGRLRNSLGTIEPKKRGVHKVSGARTRSPLPQGGLEIPSVANFTIAIVNGRTY